MTFFKKDKIAIVLNSLIRGYGVEKRTYEQVLYLRGKNISVDVIVLRETGKEAERYRQAGIKVYFIKVYKADKKGLRPNPLGFIKFAWFLLKKRYGIILGAIAPSHYFVRIACLPPLGRKVFAFERTDITNRKWKYRIMDSLFSLWTKNIICVSPHIRDSLVKSKVPRRKIVVIEEGYSHEAPTYTNRHTRKKGYFTFGTVGQLVRSKRPDFLLYAFGKVKRLIPKSYLIIVGDGDLMDQLTSLAKEMGILDSVKFTGHLQDTTTIYGLFDCFVFPSISEGFPGVIVEAWLNRLPVIASNVKPMNHYISHLQNGILFDPFNLEDLIYWMLRIAKDTELRERLATEGYKTARKTFDYETQLFKLYRLLTH